jgi:hypothetical protein
VGGRGGAEKRKNDRATEFHDFFPSKVLLEPFEELTRGGADLFQPRGQKIRRRRKADRHFRKNASLARTTLGSTLHKVGTLFDR